MMFALGRWSHLFGLLPVLLAGCTAFNLDVMAQMSKLKEKIETETLVVSPRINEQRPGVELGFVAYMAIEKAEEMGAPTGKRFVELLNERVAQKEIALGHKLCSHGYHLGPREPFASRGGDWKGIWTVGFDCNSSASQS